MTALVLTAALKGTLLLALAWAVTVLLRRSAADLRHRVWLAAFCGLALLLIPAPVPEAARVTVAYTFVADAATAATQSSIAIWPAIYALGVALLLLRFVVGTLHLMRLTLRSERTAMPGVRMSSAIASPLTWGVLQPSILLPSYAADWSDEKRNVAMEHERAHIARGDWFWQSFAQLMTAIFWFHPLVWFAAARLRHEAELAVDDAVLSTGAEASGYAEQLLEVAHHVRTASPALAVAMVRRPALTARVTAILDATRSRTRAGLRSRVAIAIAALSLVPLLAAFQSQPISSLPAALHAPEFAEPAYPEPAPTPVPALVQTTVEQVAQQEPAPPPAPQEDRPVYPIGGGVSAPAPIYTVQPIYTEEARRDKVQGDVLVTVLIDEAGIPDEITVVKGLGAGLDEAAVEAVRLWRFKPGFKDGEAVRVKATISVSFKLL
ncbi:MAG: M56 family metallopeptidase [Acidobacteriota bacterium]